MLDLTPRQKNIINGNLQQFLKKKKKRFEYLFGFKARNTEGKSHATINSYNL